MTSHSIGAKAAHVRRARDTSGGKHHCHWPGCGRRVPPAKWGCAHHWYQLPIRLRTLIWRTYRPGQEETKTPSRKYIKAAQEVQEWIRENHPPQPGLGI